jgi:hypothetical protein
MDVRFVFSLWYLAGVKEMMAGDAQANACRRRGEEWDEDVLRVKVYICVTQLIVCKYDSTNRWISIMALWNTFD